MNRVWRIIILLACAAALTTACDTQEKEKDKPPLEVKKEEAKDSTRLDPAPDTAR